MCLACDKAVPHSPSIATKVDLSKTTNPTSGAEPAISSATRALQTAALLQPASREFYFNSNFEANKAKRAAKLAKSASASTPAYVSAAEEANFLPDISVAQSGDNPATGVFPQTGGNSVSDKNIKHTAAAANCPVGHIASASTGATAVPTLLVFPLAAYLQEAIYGRSKRGLFLDSGSHTLYQLSKDYTDTGC